MNVPLIPPAMRSALRNVLASVPVRVIEYAFGDEGFLPRSDVNIVGSGVRRATARQLEAAVDWDDPAERLRAASAYSVLLRQAPEYVEELKSELFRYGWTVTDDLAMVPLANGGFTPGSLGDLPDADVVLDHLRRQLRNAEIDPKAAIGASKELIESTSKIVLRYRGLAVPDKFPALVAAAERALLLHAKSDRGDLPALDEGFRTTLAGLHQIALGINSVRGTARSTGHGHAELSLGLGERHARLIVGAAQVWCQMMLDTLADPNAPWRRMGSAP